MANTYEWRIDKMTAKIQEGELQNVIFQISWTYLARYSEDKNIVASTSGFINVKYNEGEPFIPYEDLTKEDVVSWLEASEDINIENMQENLNKQIDEKKNPVDEYFYPMWD